MKPCLKRPRTEDDTSAVASKSVTWSIFTESKELSSSNEHEMPDPEHVLHFLECLQDGWPQFSSVFELTLLLTPIECQTFDRLSATKFAKLHNCVRILLDKETEPFWTSATRTFIQTCLPLFNDDTDLLVDTLVDIGVYINNKYRPLAGLHMFVIIEDMKLCRLAKQINTNTQYVYETEMLKRSNKRRRSRSCGGRIEAGSAFSGFSVPTQ